MRTPVRHRHKRVLLLATLLFMYGALEGCMLTDMMGGLGCKKGGGGGGAASDPNAGTPPATDNAAAPAAPQGGDAAPALPGDLGGNAGAAGGTPTLRLSQPFPADAAGQAASDAQAVAAVGGQAPAADGQGAPPPAPPAADSGQGPFKAPPPQDPNQIKNQLFKWQPGTPTDGGGGNGPTTPVKPPAPRPQTASRPASV